MLGITDLTVYHGYAERNGNGESPCTSVFPLEYPPPAVALLCIPVHTGNDAVYGVLFNVLLMEAFTIATRVVIANVACRLWPRGGRAYVAAALLIAIFLLCVVGRSYTAAGFVIGMGFALKLTPLALLPLVLMLAGPRRGGATLFPKGVRWPALPWMTVAVVPNRNRVT